VKWSLFVGPALLCVTVLICFAVGEWALKRTHRYYPVQMGWVGEFQNRLSANFMADAQTGWRMRPSRTFVWTFDEHEHTYTSNSQGFRSLADFDGHDKRFKLAFVGDSYTFGTGVPDDECYPALLGADAPNRVSWNFAMPGFGVDQAWLSARYQALPLKPDLLVVGLVDADFSRSQVPFRRLEGFGKPTFKLVDGRLAQRGIEAPPNFLMQYLDERSRLWSLAVNTWQAAGRRYRVGEYWTLNQAIIESIREDSRKANVPALFVYIPVKGLRPFPSLHTYMQRTGADYIDLTDQRPVPPRSIYLKSDGHLSAEGHRYVANLIEQWMKGHPGFASAGSHP
jgi:hypothetical protein